MKRIVKGNSPAAFEEWKNQEPKPKTWDDFKSNLPDKPEEGIIYYSKAELRTQLLDEQGFICCYCNCKIENTHAGTEIEHFKSRRGYPSKIFEYQNLLASCKGGQTNSNKESDIRWCNANKGDSDDILSPLSPDCENEFLYDIEGGIFSKTAIGKKTLGVLNLQNSYLQEQRKEAISAYFDENGMATISAKDAKIVVEKLKAKNDKRFTPFCMAIIYNLNQVN